MHTARACESTGALADHQRRECPLRSSRAVKAPSRILRERELSKLKPPRCPKCATFGQFSLAAQAKSGTWVGSTGDGSGQHRMLLMRDTQTERGRYGTGKHQPSLPSAGRAICSLRHENPAAHTATAGETPRSPAHALAGAASAACAATHAAALLGYSGFQRHVNIFSRRRPPFCLFITKRHLDFLIMMILL